MEQKTSNGAATSLQEMLSRLWLRTPARLSLWPALAVLAIMAVTTALLWMRLGLFYRERIDVHYVQQVERIAVQDAFLRAWSQDDGALGETLRQLAQVTDARLTAFDSQGAVLADSLGSAAPVVGDGMPEEVRAALAGNIETHRREAGGEPMMFVAAPVVVEGEIAGAVRLAASNQELEATLAQARNRLLAICAAASLLILLIQAVTAGGRASLRKLAEMIERITGGV